MSTSCQTTALERVVTMDLTWVGHVLVMCCDEYFSETYLHSKSGRLGGMARGETFDKRCKEIESYHIRVVANKLDRQQLYTMLAAISTFYNFSGSINRAKFNNK